jgi:predicted AAA+ superfamily ATPase
VNKVIDGVEIKSWINRSINEKLIDWIKSPFRRGVLLHGPRQAGKTLLLKAFGKDNFASTVYIDLANRAIRNKFEHYCSAKFAEHHYPFPLGNGEFIVEALAEMGIELNDSPDTLLIIDEIQESPYAYGEIRYFVRCLKCKVAFTGSYLGDFLFKSDVRESAGDVFRLDLETVSYVEFLKSTSFYEEFKSIDIFEPQAFHSQRGSELKSVLRNSYYDYCQMGGYPEVISSYLEGASMEKCIISRDAIANDFYDECGKRSDKLPELKDWDEILGRIAYGVVKNKEWKSVLEDKDLPESLKDISRKSIEDIEGILRWFTISKMIDHSFVTTKPFTRGLSTPYKRLFFTDIGILRYMANKTLGFIRESDARGFVSENFVFLALRDLKDLFCDKDVWKYDSKGINGIYEEADFSKLADNGNKRILIEVKNKRGGTPTSQKALDRGEADYIIKIADADAKLSDTSAVLPFYAVERLETIVKKLENGEIGLKKSF